MYSIGPEVSETYILAKVQEDDRAGSKEMSHVSPHNTGFKVGNERLSASEKSVAFAFAN